MLVLCLVTLVGCSAGSPSSPPIVSTTPGGPASGAEFLYQFPDGSDVQVSTVDPSTGVLSSPIDAPDHQLPMTAFNLAIQPSPMATPSGKFLYIGGSWNGLGTRGPGIFGYSITGTMGELSPIPGNGPFFPQNPLNLPTGIVMDGQGKYIYLSDTNYGSIPLTVQPTNKIRAYAIDPTSGGLQEGPILTDTSALSLSVQAVDPGSKFLYAWNQTQNAFGISVYAVNQATGSLTEVPASPYPVTPIQASDSIGVYNNETIFTSSSGKFIYAGFGLIDSTNGGQIFAFSVDPATGALTALQGSPFSLGNTYPETLTLHPSGKFLYVGGQTATTNGPTQSRSVFAVDPTSGAIATTPISYVADSNCCQFTVTDPTGEILVDLGGYSTTSGSSTTRVNNLSSFTVDGSTGLLTPAPGSPFIGSNPFYTVVSGLIVKIP
jgi:hypothetical protein